MLDEGDSAPTFVLPDQDGTAVSIGDYRGQQVVVYFYPRANTDGCTTEAKGFRDEWERFEARDVAILAISDDPVDDLKAFEEAHDLPFPLLSDEEGEVATLYGAYGEKQMFGRTFDGVFRTTFVVGQDGTVEAVFENVTPEGHATAVLEVIEEAA